MSNADLETAAPPRRASWKWLVCGLLLLATMINYMDRLTLNLTAPEIRKELKLTNEQYGEIEWVFGVGFAFGALLVGWCADRWNVRWIYPAAVLAWSASGAVTGLARTLSELKWCRFFLGLSEAGNWPCALRTTQHILPPGQRTMGNSILQSGAAFGAIVTPLIVQVLVSDNELGSWRRPFFVIGAIGSSWVFLWLAFVRREDLATPNLTAKAADPAAESLLSIYLQRRFLVLIVLVITINLTWHFFRAWLPLYLRENLNYSKATVNLFISAYYVATDVGALTSGFATLYFARRGFTVHGSRVLVFLGAALLASLSVTIPLLGEQVRRQPMERTVSETIPDPNDPNQTQKVEVPVRDVGGEGLVLFGALLVIGFGALALFPAYYSFSQELTVKNQGKVTGTLGFCTWMASATMHPFVGRWLDWTKFQYGVADYQSAIALMGLVPLFGLFALVFFWGKTAESNTAV